jgi:transposase
VLRTRVAQLQALVKAAHGDPHRRAGEGVPVRIGLAAERHRALRAQKHALRERILALYAATPEAAWLDTIPGSNRLYNAITLALVGDFSLYDSPRAIVKLAGSEVNWHESGDWKGKSRISHRGRSLLRSAAYQQARRLVHDNTTYKARFQHLLHRSTRPALNKHQAYVAIGNSYLRTAHVLVTKKKTWQEPT